MIARAALALALLAGAARAEPEAAPAPMKPEAKAAYDRGIQLYQEGRFDEAIEALRAGNAIEPRPEFLYSLGQSERRRGDCARAIEHYQAYLGSAQLSLKQAGAVHLLIDRCTVEQLESAERLYQSSDFAGAARVLERAVAQPLNLTRAQLVESWGRLGVALCRLGRDADAERAFGELLKLDRERALDGQAGPRCLALHARVKNPPAPAKPARTRTLYGPARLHVGALLFSDLVPLAATGHPQSGAEVSASFAPGAWVDLGAAASFGSNVGARVHVALHPSRVTGGRLRWYLQGRVVVHPLPGGAAIGGGALVGGTLELGPGRITAGVVGEAYAVLATSPAAFFPVAVLGVAGYEIDLLKASRVVPIE